MHWARLEFSANRSAFANALAVRHKVGFNPFFMLGIIPNSATPYHRILQRNLHSVLLFRIVRGNVLVARATTNRAANTFRVPTKSFYRNLTRTTRSLPVAFRRGLSLQESAEIIQLIKHPPTLFNLSHFFKGCDPRFSTCEKTISLKFTLEPDFIQFKIAPRFHPFIIFSATCRHLNRKFYRAFVFSYPLQKAGGCLRP